MANFHTVLRALSFYTADKTLFYDNALYVESFRNDGKLKHNNHLRLCLPFVARLYFRDLPYCVPTFRPTDQWRSGLSHLAKRRHWFVVRLWARTPLVQQIGGALLLTVTPFRAREDP
jgi:hypothetical protein